MKMKKDMDLFLSPVSAFLFFSDQFESVYVVFTLEILDSNTIDKANLKVQQGSKQTFTALKVLSDLKGL